MARELPRFWLWKAPAALAGLAALLFAGGFWMALRGTLGEPLGAPPPSAAGKRAIPRAPGRRVLLVLGDSLARGTGDETGKGYAGDFLEILKKSGPVEMDNLAVNGAESGDLKGLLENSNVVALAARADVILLSAGANDLTHSVPMGTGAPAQVLGAVGDARARFAGNLRQILGRLRESNASAPIYVLGLYNPFEDSSPRARAGVSMLFSWNAIIAETALAFPNVSVVPTFDIFAGRADRLAADHFHPNRRGHELIAQRIAQLLPDS